MNVGKPSTYGAVVGALLSLAPNATLGAPALRSVPKPLPSPPTLSRIRVEAARDHVLVLHDVLLRRGEWTGGDLDLFVAFGAPGSPRAIDARLYEADDTNDASSPAGASETIPVTRAFQRPANARLLLGSASMAGAVLHVRESSFRALTQRTGVVRIRLRSLVDLPVADLRGGHEVVIRLGSHQGEPDALGVIEVAAEDGSARVERAEVHLCGPEADPWPLSVRILGGAISSASGAQAQTVAPVSSVRHASDDLCVRFWTNTSQSLANRR